MVLQVPETLPGPGAYRLSVLSAPCPAAICPNPSAIKPPVIEMRFHDKGDGGTMLPPFMIVQGHIGNLMTASYQGKQLWLSASAGSYADKLGQPKAHFPEGEPLRALQDAKGVWHVSRNAWSKLELSHPSCTEPWFS